ncbi:MAG: efflux RND transporter periplasmic adaptor subunit [Acidobacteriota bacterium]
MFRKYRASIATAFQALAGSCLFIFLSGCTETEPPDAAATKTGEIKVVTSTNGVIEPSDNTLIYASIDGFVQSIECREGSEIKRGQVLFRMNSPQTRIALAEARAALLETRRQSRVVLEGPNKEELDSLQATIDESSMQLRQLTEKLSAEESLMEKGAVSRESVENLREQRNLLEVRINALEEKKTNTLNRYSESDKQLMRDQVKELSTQVQLLEKQAQNASITSPIDGLLYSLEIKPGAFVSTGQLLAQIYQPGQVRLRAYVDEPDLARIQKGQPVTVEWDGMPMLMLKSSQRSKRTPLLFPEAPFSEMKEYPRCCY